MVDFYTFSLRSSLLCVAPGSHHLSKVFVVVITVVVFVAVAVAVAIIGIAVAVAISDDVVPLLFLNFTAAQSVVNLSLPSSSLHHPL